MNTETESKYQLIDSFVYQVGQYLPQNQREEISADLRQSIYEEIEAASEEGDVQVSEDDLVQIIGRFGHPLKVASSYLPNRYVIGPEIYPVYTRALRTVLTIAIFAQVSISLLLTAAGSESLNVWSLLGSSISIALWAFIAVTSVCVAIEYSGERLRWYERWDPRDLARNAVGPIDRSDVITNLLSEGFFLLWWNDAIYLQNFLPDSAIAVTLSDAWSPFGLALNLIFGVSFCIHAYVLVMGNWRKFAMIGEIVLFAAMVGIGLVLLTSNELAVLAGVIPDKLADKFDLRLMVDRILRVTIAAVIIFTIWDILKGLKMWRGGYAVGYRSDSTSAD